MSQRTNDMLLLSGLFIGAVVGAAAATLLTPHSGAETREQIAERGVELKQRADDAVQRAQQIASDAVAKVQVAANDLLKTPGQGSDDMGGGI
ncbi:MAG: YtxH domain-containing protein [Chloroflexi bacterium SZAS-1]|jgi:gas vesicle protein|nr:YtxH domain-containing protein [Chloroflexi bacterium SZAS-1]HNP86725.1 YtxH domain-containing protein [Kouleothrix sp.]